MCNLSNFKTVANNNLNRTQMMEFLFDKKENIEGKGENGATGILSYSQCFFGS